MRKLPKTRLIWFTIIVLVLMLDQFSKYWAETNLSLHQQVPIFALLNLSRWHNKGAAFSFLSNATGWQALFFITVSSVVCLGILIWLCRLGYHQRWLGYCLSFIFGGALGNLIDRVRLGYVIDFIQVHYHSWYFPVFNVADIAISIGAIMLIIEILFISKAMGTNYEEDD